MTKRALLVLVLWCSQASAYIGTFVPALDRNVVTVTFVDAQVAGPICATHALNGNALDVVLSPLMAQAAACAMYDPPTVIAPISFGPGSIWALQYLATPDGLLGHEFLHTIKRDVHPALLPFVESDYGVRPAYCEDDRSVAGTQSETDMRPARERGTKRDGLPAKDRDAETVCVIFIDACNPTYAGLGALVRECLSKETP